MSVEGTLRPHIMNRIIQFRMRFNVFSRRTSLEACQYKGIDDQDMMNSIFIHDLTNNIIINYKLE